MSKKALFECQGCGVKDESVMDNMIMNKARLCNDCMNKIKGVSGMNEWKELDINNLPPDILVKNAYDFYWKKNGPKAIFTMDTFTTFKDVIFPIYQDKENYDTLYYRKAGPKPPTHEEILSKWWYVEVGSCGRFWIKPFYYDVTRKKYGILLKLPENPSGTSSEHRAFVYNNWFIGRQSADIPPENKE